MKGGAGMSLSPELRDRANFRHWTPVTLRYVDEDPNGHINNAVFATFLESGRVALLYKDGQCAGGPGTAFVIVRLVLDFLAEMRYPGIAEVGTRLERIGRSSLTLGQGIFKDGVCAGVAETILVLIDSETRRPVPLPPAVTELLQGLSAG